MTKPEFSELVEWIVAQWGPSELWAEPGVLYERFESLDSVAVWESATAYADSSPELAVWPPKPPGLRAAALQRMREAVVPALPETTEAYGWADFSMRTYGEVISLKDAVERSWKERV